MPDYPFQKHRENSRSTWSTSSLRQYFARKVARLPAILPLNKSKFTLTTVKTSTRKLRIKELAPHISMRGQHVVKKSRPISRNFPARFLVDILNLKTSKRHSNHLLKASRPHCNWCIYRKIGKHLRASIRFLKSYNVDR